MKMAIMQPYFFPYIGQFQLIHAVDRFILCDDVQYIAQGWINRNRIRKPGDGYQYIIIPVAKHHRTERIRNIQSVGGNVWKTTVLRQVEYYRKIAPYYSNVFKILKDCLALDERNITKLNGYCMQAVCDYLGIRFNVEISSELNLNYADVKVPEDWAINICGQLGASEYYNPPGGMALYHKDHFAQKNIRLNFVKPLLNEYDQHTNSFIPGLSVIDVMMFNDPAEIKEMLNQYQLL